MTNSAIAPIVSLKADRIVASSRDVAEVVGKEHRNVLADIDRLMSEGALNFQRAPYFDQQNDQTYRAFDMTRDGFKGSSERTSKDTQKAGQDHYETMREADLRMFCAQFTVSARVDTWVEV